MNKILLKRTGDLEINGVKITHLFGIHAKTKDKGHTTVTIQFDVDAFELEVGVADFEWAKDCTPEELTALVRQTQERRDGSNLQFPTGQIQQEPQQSPGSSQWKLP